MAAINFATQDEYRTPKSIIDFFGPFDYDPATTKEYAAYHNIRDYDTIQTDGLRTDWSFYKKIWINPPFSKKFDFLEKAVKSNKDVFILLPISALATKKFATIVKCGYTLFLPDGRNQVLRWKKHTEFSSFRFCNIKAVGRRTHY